MSRKGFTAVELMIVVILIGVIAAIGFPKIRQALDKSNVRSARVSITTFVAIARGSAVQRGCGAVVHFVSGTTSRAWVTACPRFTAGAGTVDTVATIDDLEARFNVSMQATTDSVQYDPRGLRRDNALTIVRFSGNSASNTDSVTINQMGKVVR